MPTLVPVSLTFIQYVKGDTLGCLLAYTSLLPIFIVCAVPLTLALRRDLAMLYFGVGMVLNEVLNYTIKHTVKEARPLSVLDDEQRWAKYGMPSNHAQLMFFFSIYWTLFLMRRCTFLPRQEISKTGIALIKTGLSVCLIMAATLVGYSRVYLEHHTVWQVQVGSGIGALFAILWFRLGSLPLVCALMTRIEGSWVAKVFLLKDASSIPDLALFEYEQVMKEKGRQMKTQ